MSFLIIDNVGYETESKTLFRNMTTPPDSARKRIINALIKRLKGDGAWNLLDTLWLYAAHDQQASRLNWKNPGTFTITEVNSPTWTINQGYTGNGTNMYLNTNWNPSTNGVNYVLNSGAFGLYGRLSMSANTNAEGGALDASSRGPAILSRFTADVFRGRINTVTNTTAANTNTQGLFATARTASNSQDIYKNGVLQANSTAASSVVPSVNLFFLAYNGNGTATGFSVQQISFAFSGSGSINQLLLYNAVQQYMTSLGTQV